MNMPQFLVELTTYVALSYKMYVTELPAGNTLNPARFIHSQKITFQASCYYHFHTRKRDAYQTSVQTASMMVQPR